MIFSEIVVPVITSLRAHTLEKQDKVCIVGVHLYRMTCFCFIAVFLFCALCMLLACYRLFPFPYLHCRLRVSPSHEPIWFFLVHLDMILIKNKDGFMGPF
jgi:hypothetical protein